MAAAAAASASLPPNHNGVLLRVKRRRDEDPVALLDLSSSTAPKKSRMAAAATAATIGGGGGGGVQFSLGATLDGTERGQEAEKQLIQKLKTEAKTSLKELAKNKEPAGLKEERIRVKEKKAKETRFNILQRLRGEEASAALHIVDVEAVTVPLEVEPSGIACNGEVLSRVRKKEIDDEENYVYDYYYCGKVPQLMVDGNWSHCRLSSAQEPPLYMPDVGKSRSVFPFILCYMESERRDEE